MPHQPTSAIRHQRLRLATTKRPIKHGKSETKNAATLTTNVGALGLPRNLTAKKTINNAGLMEVRNSPAASLTLNAGTTKFQISLARRKKQTASEICCQKTRHANLEKSAGSNDFIRFVFVFVVSTCYV